MKKLILRILGCVMLFTACDDKQEENYTTIPLSTTLIVATTTPSPTPSQLPVWGEDKVIVTDKTGRYSLFTRQRESGDDYLYDFTDLYLKDNTTGQEKYLDTMSFVYGRDEGFLSNGDVYVLEYDDFLVYDTDMDNKEPIFRLSEHNEFSFNYEYPYRELRAVRRDPVDFTYLAVYCDRETYKVGYFDKDGILQREYDTGQQRIDAGHQTIAVDIWLENDGYTLNMIVYYGYPEEPVAKGKLNLQTGEYTALLSPELENGYIKE